MFHYNFILKRRFETWKDERIFKSPLTTTPKRDVELSNPIKTDKII